MLHTHRHEYEKRHAHKASSVYKHPHQYKLFLAHIVHWHDMNTHSHLHSPAHARTHARKRTSKLLQITCNLCCSTTFKRIICELSGVRPTVRGVRMCVCPSNHEYQPPSHEYFIAAGLVSIVEFLKMVWVWAVCNTMYKWALPSFELNCKMCTGRDALEFRWTSYNLLNYLIFSHRNTKRLHFSIA